MPEGRLEQATNRGKIALKFDFTFQHAIDAWRCALFS
jgi:hypothetical protein